MIEVLENIFEVVTSRVEREPVVSYVAIEL